MNRLLMKSVCLLALLVTVSAFAQNPPTPELQKGFTGFEEFQGTVNSDSKIFKLDSNAGYDFNKHFGIFAGMPLYFANTQTTTTQVNGTATTTTTNVTNNGLGNAYFGFAMRAPNKTLDYSSTVTLAAPTGSTSKGFSSGRANADWTNRFEHSFDRLTPFFEGGLANTWKKAANLNWSNTFPWADRATRSFRSAIKRSSARSWAKGRAEKARARTALIWRLSPAVLA